MNVTRYRESSPISSPRRTHSTDNGGANANRQESKGSRDALTETLFQFLICLFSEETRQVGGAESPSHRIACNVINILYLMLVIMHSLLGNSNKNSNISSYRISEINRRATKTTTLTLSNMNSYI